MCSEKVSKTGPISGPAFGLELSNLETRNNKTVENKSLFSAELHCQTILDLYRREPTSQTKKNSRGSLQRPKWPKKMRPFEPSGNVPMLEHKNGSEFRANF